ncbi:amino acid transporter [Chiua virens]|nr:amino acid transporter [Chiua virens]
MPGTLQWMSIRKKLDSDEGIPEQGVDEDEVVQEVEPVLDTPVGPGGLTFDEDAAGGLGRHLGIVSCTLLIVGNVIGTGIFSTPSSILSGVGSIGASLMLWVLGFLLSFCGLFIWLEFGTMFPRSGGEKVYLEAVYHRPKYLATVIFAANSILLNFDASGCIVSVCWTCIILVSAGRVATTWSERGIAVGGTFRLVKHRISQMDTLVIVFVVLIHGFAPRIGVYIMNFLAVFKIVILLFVVITGWVVLSGKSHIVDPGANFNNAFAGSSHSGSDYATAMFKVLFTYSGWSSINYVLNNVKNPIRTLKIAGPLGLAICATLYILANIAYFSAATKAEIESSGVTVAALFFRNVFGTAAERALSVFVALRFDLSARIHFTIELAKEGIPLPFGNRFWASNWPTGKSPIPGLLIHFTVSVIVILAPPMNIAYPFILDVEGYPAQIIYLFVVMGLFWMRWKRPGVHRPFKVWWPLAMFYLAAAVFLIIAPFLPPTNGVGDTPPLPYYLYCLVGIGVLLVGVVYWAGWRIVLPKVLGYELEPHKETLKDGTVVTLFARKKVS